MFATIILMDCKWYWLILKWMIHRHKRTDILFITIIVTYSKISLKKVYSHEVRDAVRHPHTEYQQQAPLGTESADGRRLVA